MHTVCFFLYQTLDCISVHWVLASPHHPFPVSISLKECFVPRNSNKAIPFWRETAWKSQVLRAWWTLKQRKWTWKSVKVLKIQHMCIYLSLSEVIVGIVTAKKKSKKSLLLSLYLKKKKILTAIEYIYLIYSEKF